MILLLVPILSMSDVYSVLVALETSYSPLLPVMIQMTVFSSLMLVVVQSKAVIPV